MTAARPTFSDHWHRVASLRPRLSPTLRVHRQRTRAEAWYVLEESLSSRFARANAPAYRFVALLDGTRTVDEAWRETAHLLGDEAPTQPEALQILAQLHEAGLINTDDASPSLASLVRTSHRRKRREARAHLGALLFIRVPLFNPDRLLDALAPFARPLVSRPGALLWCTLVAFGLWHVIANADRFLAATATVLRSENLLLLYLAFAGAKLAHELGHGLILKALGEGRGGVTVPRFGLLLLLFLPFPYVDATGAWALPSKWKRALVASAGVIVELAIASVAAVVWASTGEASAVNALAYNLVLATSVTTLLFNANPLMRYDGYHVLSDLTQTPNLASRASREVGAFVKRRFFGVRSALGTATHSAERAFFVAYAFASNVYRLFVYAVIALFVLDQQFAFGVLLLLVAAFELVVTPIAKFVWYLLTDAELATRRPHAIGVTAAFLALVLTPVAALPIPTHARFEGVVEPASYIVVRAETAGVVRTIAPSGTRVTPDDPPIVALELDELARDRRVLELERERLALLRRSALRDEPAQLARIDARAAVIDDQLDWIADRIAKSRIRADEDALWISADAERLRGGAVRPGEMLGALVTSDARAIRARASQETAGALDRAERVVVRAHGDASSTFVAHLLTAGPSAGNAADLSPFLIAAQERPPSRVGEGEFVLHFGVEEGAPLVPGQRVAVRASTGSSTVATLAWDALLRMLQQRDAP